jgi:hypothetical protein
MEDLEVLELNKYNMKHVMKTAAVIFTIKHENLLTFTYTVLINYTELEDLKQKIKKHYDDGIIEMFNTKDQAVYFKGDSIIKCIIDFSSEGK